MTELVNEDTCHLSLADARDIAARCHVGARDDTPDKELLLMLRLNTSFGLLMHFDEPGLQDLVILKVQWLLDLMAAMLCRRQLAERLNSASSHLPVRAPSMVPSPDLHQHSITHIILTLFILPAGVAPSG